MKKVYALLAVMMFASFSFAQVAKMDMGSNQNRQLPFKGIMKAGDAKPAASEGWVYYSEYDAAYWAADDLTSGGAYYFQSDSLGLQSYSDGYGHPFMYSAGQTFDFTSSFFDEASAEGDISFMGSPSLNIDSIYIQTMYFRDGVLPAGSKDTIVVGVLVADEMNVAEYTSYSNTCFWDIDYNPTTGVQANATIYKFPIGDDEVSEPVPDQEGYYYYSNLYFPIGMTNVTGKAIHVAYAYKRGYEVSLNDTLPTSFTLYTWKSCDDDYFITIDNPLRCYNKSHGGYVLSFTNGDVDYYYPGFALGSDAESSSSHFPRMAVKFSCDNCEIVNVPELEKTNPTVYPNPATNNFTVNLGNDEKANIQLFNIVGQQVYSETITGSAQVNVANLHSGVYMLKVNQNGKVYTTKVVVK